MLSLCDFGDGQDHSLPFCLCLWEKLGWRFCITVDRDGLVDVSGCGSMISTCICLSWWWNSSVGRVLTFASCIDCHA